MKKTTYTEEFEKFWTIWKRITGRWQGRHVAYRYWKRDRLDSRLDEILAALTNENKARKDSKARNIWMPEWCLASTWLNQKRYEDEPPEKEKCRKQSTLEDEPTIKSLTPEQRAQLKETRFYKLVLATKSEAEYQQLTPEQKERRKQEMIKELRAKR